MIVEKTEGGVLSFQNKNIETFLTIPNSVPNSNSMLCQVITISYELKIEAWTAGCHFNIVLTAPIVIGSDPLILDPSSIQPTFSGQLDRPPIDFIPVLPYTDDTYQSIAPALPNYEAPSTPAYDKREN